MKIALCTKGTDLNSELDQRFGRCENFLIYNNVDDSCESIENTAKNASGGAGVMAVQLISDQDCKVLIAPELGPQAMDALIKLGIPAFSQENCKNASEAITAWKAHQLKEIQKAEPIGLHRA